jgi:hypothetical protein
MRLSFSLSSATKDSVSPRGIGGGAIVRVGRRTLQDWRDKHEDFRDASEIGTELALMWWENVIRSGYTESKDSDKVNMKVVSFFLRNRFPSVPIPMPRNSGG